MYSVGQATCVILVALGSRCCDEVRNAIGRPVNEKGGLGGRAGDCDAAVTGLSHPRTWEFTLPIKRAPCWVEMARPSHPTPQPPSAQSLLRIIQEERGFSGMLECPGGSWRGSDSQPLPSLQQKAGSLWREIVWYTSKVLQHLTSLRTSFLI